MSLPTYPRKENGDGNHISAIEMMFGRLPSAENPVHVKVDGTAITFTGYSPSGETLYWCFSQNYVDHVTRDVYTGNVWDDWVNDRLMPVRVEYLAADEAVYNKEEKESFEAAMERDTSEFLTDSDANEAR